MAREHSFSLLDPLRKLIRGGRESLLTDAELLERFIAAADAAAFEALFWRHAAMVIGPAI